MAGVQFSLRRHMKYCKVELHHPQVAPDDRVPQNKWEISNDYTPFSNRLTLLGGSPNTQHRTKYS